MWDQNACFGLIQIIETLIFSPTRNACALEGKFQQVVFTAKLLFGYNDIRHSIPSKFLKITFVQLTNSNVLFTRRSFVSSMSQSFVSTFFVIHFRGLYFNFDTKNVGILFIHNEIIITQNFSFRLLHFTTNGTFPLRNVLGSMPSDILRRAECWTCCRCCNERPKWSFSCPRYVCSIPSVLWIFRVVWRNSDLLALDHLSKLHSVWLWSNSFGNLWIRTWKAKMFPNILPFQVTTHYTGRAWYVGIGY